MKMKSMKAGALALFVLGITAAGCSHRHEGPVERAGERGDEIVDNVKKGKPMFHRKGSLEKAGEAVDDAFDGDGR